MAAPSADQCKKRLSKIAARLPEAAQSPGGEDGRHLTFVVRKKTFAYFTDDHHGDGRLSLICRAPAGEQAALVGSQPESFYVPPYLGHRGWVGMWLDVPGLDWTEAEELIIEAYRLAAPKRLAASME
jgi:hypothetical protein